MNLHITKAKNAESFYTAKIMIVPITILKLCKKTTFKNLEIAKNIEQTLSSK